MSNPNRASRHLASKGRIPAERNHATSRRSAVHLDRRGLLVRLASSAAIGAGSLAMTGSGVVAQHASSTPGAAAGPAITHRQLQTNGISMHIVEADLDVYTAAYERSGFRGPLGLYRNMDRDWEDLPEVGATGVRQPARFIAGRGDSAVVFLPFEDLVEPMEAAVPNLDQIVLLPGCGHWTQQERPDDVNAGLLDFLDRASGL
jgi:pimeloyl-ACP methyl ester carboxylesterase